MTHSRDVALAEILAEAEVLRLHRTDGAAYLKKCDNLVGRIENILNGISVSDLDTEDLEKMKSIKEIILREEFYAQSSVDFRNPKKWLGSLDD